ncbi:MAG: hydroxymethylglutaryl-CoA reductase [Candidatus Micrarchaeaceae archaeon]
MELEEAVKKLIAGEIKSYQLSGLLRNEKTSAEARRAYIEDKYSVKIKAAAETLIDFDDAAKRNIENMIGAVQMPLGYVEMRVDGKESPIFMATTEGKLIAGINRGASAINNSGGTKTTAIKNGMSRSVIIETNGGSDSMKAINFINSEEGKQFLSAEYSKSTRRGSLLEISAYTTGRLLFVRYVADTAAAMGMNMVTIASTAMTNSLIEKLNGLGIPSKLASESGNMCTDKKPAMVNVIMGRGISVVAEAVVKKEILDKYFKVSASSIEKINYEKNYIGSGLAGSSGHNAQIANILASTFIAYGQDAAQVVDGSSAFDDVKVQDNGDLYISVYIPALEVGTFGGGTAREVQKEMLKASGVYGEGDETGRTKERLASLIASASLAGELNLLAAEASSELFKAHSAIKRGK